MEEGPRGEEAEGEEIKEALARRSKRTLRDTKG